MFGDVTALEGSHGTGKYRNESMLHTCVRHAAWDPHRYLLSAQVTKEQFGAALLVQDATELSCSAIAARFRA